MIKMKAGTREDFGGSMAEAIENAFKKEWQDLKEMDLPVAGQDDRRLFFIAIAQGVIKHLQERAGESILVNSVAVTQDNTLITSQGRVDITNAPASFTSYDGYYYQGTVSIPNVPVTVTQDSGNANKVKSAGSGNQVTIITEGVLL